MASSSRRDFLRLTLAGAAAGLATACAAPAPERSAVQPTTPSEAVPTPAAPAAPTVEVSAPLSRMLAPAANAALPLPVGVDKRVLVVVQLSGGNDGLNAVVPYGNGLYYQLRPQIAVAADQVLRLDDQVGLHPGLRSLKALYDARKLAIVQGVGYPNPSRSHFRSMEIWHTAKPQGPVPSEGWLGAFMSEVYRVGESPFQCVNFGPSVPQALLSQHAPVAAMQDTTSFQFLVDRRLPTMKDPLLKTFGQVYSKPARQTSALDMVASTWTTTTTGVDVLNGISDKYQPAAQYPANPLGRTLQQVAQMLSSEIGTRVFYVQLGGFDTHANEKPAHATLMSQLADSLAAFQADLEAHGRAEQVLTIGFSEFGRRVKENGSQGTDHGAAGPMFVLGQGVKGGIYGEHPSLSNLDDGDLRHMVDFRAVYATVIEDWLGAPSYDVLGARFDRLDFIA